MSTSEFRPWTVWFAVIPLVFAVVPVLFADGGRIPIYGPFTISSSGSYILTRDLSVSSGDAITITHDDVTIDLNGHTISSTVSFGNGVVTYAPHTGIRITNGKIIGFGVGVGLNAVPLAGAGEYYVDHLQLSGQTYGIDVGGASPGLTRVVVEKNSIVNAATSGILLQSVDGATISDNAVSGSGVKGIEVSATNDAQITGNVVSHSLSYGIYLYSASNNTISHNTVSVNSVFGIYLTGPGGLGAGSSNNTVSYNTATGNGSIGITLDAQSDFNQITNNVSGQNSLPASGKGIYLNNCMYNSLDYNTCVNSTYGIFLDDSAANNIYSNNRLPGNALNYFGTTNHSAGGNNAGGSNF